MTKMPIRDAVSAGGVVARLDTSGAPEVVLCGRRSEKLWVLPKGTPDGGEPIEQTALREVREETGLEIKLVRLLCTMGLPSLLNPEQCIMKAIFIGAITGGNLLAGDDALDAQFFAWENLPENLATESTREALQRWRAGR